MNENPGASAPATVPPSRWLLLRDVLVFQAKLFVDGLRDLILIPVSLVAAAIGLLRGGDDPGELFYGLLRQGRMSERWINLFGAADRNLAETDSPPMPGGADEFAERVERLLIEQYERGGVTATAKRAIDRLLDAAQRAPRTTSSNSAAGRTAPASAEQSAETAERTRGIDDEQA